MKCRSKSYSKEPSASAGTICSLIVSLIPIDVKNQLVKSIIKLSSRSEVLRTVPLKLNA